VKIIPMLGNHDYLARVSVFLIAIALIVGTVSCNGGGGDGVTYNLTMAVAPSGSGNAIDQTNYSPYLAGTPVSIKAIDATYYRFSSWTAPAGTFVDDNAAQTTFIMPAQDVTVTANFATLYNLTVAVTPVGGGTAIDLTGASPYLAGAVVSIQAVANSTAGYQFASWTASAGTFADATAAQTTFTIPAQNVTVTAHFVVPQLDHFKGYWADDVTGLPIDEDVYLEDQFGAFTATVGDVWGFFNPAEKQHEGDVTPMWNPDHHFAVYDITWGGHQYWQVEVLNQFGLQNLTVSGPVKLAVPTTKEGHETAVGLDHYLLYHVEYVPYWETAVNLTDQFGGNPTVTVRPPAYFASPVQITYKGEVTEIVNPEEHALIYSIIGESYETQLQVDNQFGSQTLDVSGPVYVFVPSQKIAPPVPPLDHFKCYDATNAAPLEFTIVDLEDQFVFMPGWPVTRAEWFCNPVMKNFESIVNSDNHLTIYSIVSFDEVWHVEIVNQFGLQNLTVSGPVALAVPTWKLDPGIHEPPMYLDHYLLYEVMEGLNVTVTVDLDDQFPGTAPGVEVTEPVYFANPVLCKYHDGRYTGVWDPEAHLVFYEISDNPEYYSGVSISNQFETQSFELASTGQLLAVPSEKVSYEPVIP
jgi:uncharacterized repeat protein (TIGR02543 family)